MPQRLVVIAGPLRGLTADLEGEGLSIGRDSACTFCLPDATLSRRHALVVPAPDGAWLLRDLGSLNGVRVNGRAASESLLAEGDQIMIGESRIVFSAGDGEPPSAPGDDLPVGEPTLRVAAGDARWGAGGDGVRTAGPAPRDRLQADLAALLAADRRFAGARTEDALADALLAAALRLAPAELAVLFLDDGEKPLREVGRR